MNDKNIAYIDCISGISGDMLLSALIDLGYPVDRLNNLLKSLNLNNIVYSKKVIKSGIKSIQIDIIDKNRFQFRNIRDIEKILFNSDLSDEIIQKSIRIFHLLAQSEAKVHGCNINQVHFHEIGAVDTIIDIVGVVDALSYLNIKDVFSSAIPLARGFVKTEHGLFPIPSPALSYLLENVPVYGINEEKETVTPTGMALLKGITRNFGTFPNMSIKSVGYGAGQIDLSLPNVVRVWLGSENRYVHGYDFDKITEIETNIDDMNPQWFEPLMEKLFENGALDVCLFHAQFKKNRPGIILNIICKPQHKEILIKILFENSTTSGARISLKDRVILLRKEVFVDTPYGKIRAKSMEKGDKTVLYPEYDHLKAISRDNKIPIEEIYRVFINSIKEKE